MALWFSRPKPTPEPEAPFFVWTLKDYSVGITLFDEEHEGLAVQMSQVHAALLEKHDRTLALERLAFLIQATQAHFDHEEGVMRNVDFCEREAHIDEHRALIQQVNAMLEKVQSEGISALALPKFLKDWLIPHMQTMDRRYASAMRRHGIR